MYFTGEEENPVGFTGEELGLTNTPVSSQTRGWTICYRVEATDGTVEKGRTNVQAITPTAAMMDVEEMLIGKGWATVDTRFTPAKNES